jgi:sialate O-acetylesterase
MHSSNTLSRASDIPPSGCRFFGRRPDRLGRSQGAAVAAALLACGAIWVLSAVTLRADVTLPALFSDHAVLQRSDRVPVWGEAGPHESVTVSLAGAVARTEADGLGHWRVDLDLSRKEAGPFELSVEGRNRVVASDILVGEVWICSGQSNMEWSVERTVNAGAEIAASSDPRMRVFEPERIAAPRPLERTGGKWLVAGPASTGGFPAVGYHFCKNLERALGVPVGLISDSWGGTPVEAWTSREALESDPDLKAGSERVLAHKKEFSEQLGDYVERFGAWTRKHGREGPAPADPSRFASPGISTEDWTPLELPGSLAQAGLPDAGAVWLRRKFEITPAMTIGPLFIELGVINGFDTIYMNGVKVGETTPETAGAASPRLYFLEVKAFQAGEAVLAIRLVAPAGGAAVAGGASVIGPLPALRIDGESLNGRWLAKAEYALPPLDAAALGEYPKPMPTAPSDSKMPTYLYNGMIQPVIPYAIRGVVWYQGEDNAGRALQYRTAFPLMIRDWRARWNQGDFPFYFCQLANFGMVRPDPAESAWAELREAQTKTLSLPNTGQAILIDLGEDWDIHPRDKREVGARLARLALAETYHQEIAYSGPVFDGMTVAGDRIRIHFAHAEGGLVAHPLSATYRPTTVDSTAVPRIRHSPASEVEGFAICGADRKWVWADAKIDGDSVLVGAATVAHPVAVRYAWADSPVCNLYNGSGLPAGPFRTDDFPAVTDPVKYGL